MLMTTENRAEDQARHLELKTQDQRLKVTRTPSGTPGIAMS